MAALQSLLFCPNCQTLLDTERSDTVFLKCPSCDYTKELTEGHLLHSNKLTKSTDAVTAELPFAMIYDRAVKRSTKVKCPAVDCASNDSTQWGKYTDNGVRIQPETMLINYQDPDRVSTYVCRVCANIYRPAPVQP